MNISSATKGKKSVKPLVFPMIIGVIMGVIYTVLCILVFALVIKVAMLQDGVIPPVNQVIKITGIVIAVYFAARKAERQTFVGMLTGMAYILTGFLMFSLIDGRFGLFSVLLADIALGAAVGAIAGFIFLKLLNKEKKTGGAPARG